MVFHMAAICIDKLIEVHLQVSKRANSYGENSNTSDWQWAPAAYLEFLLVYFKTIGPETSFDLS